MALRKFKENVIDHPNKDFDDEMDPEMTEEKAKKTKKFWKTVKKIAIGAACAVGGAVTTIGIIGVSVLKSMAGQTSEEQIAEYESEEEDDDDDEEETEEE